MNKIETVSDTIIKHPHLDVNQVAHELHDKVPVATVISHNQHVRTFLRMLYKNGLKVSDSAGEDFYMKLLSGPYLAQTKSHE